MVKTGVKFYGSEVCLPATADNAKSLAANFRAFIKYLTSRASQVNQVDILKAGVEVRRQIELGEFKWN